MYKVMLDTNVLMDYYLGRQPGCPLVVELLEDLYKNGQKPYISSLSIKDLFYLMSMTFKRQARQAHDGVLTESAALAAVNVAWGCVRHAIEHYTIVNVGMAECLQACDYEALHNDFEDCLQMACVQTSKTDYFVTNDEAVIKHAPVPCLSLSDAVLLLHNQARSKKKDVLHDLSGITSGSLTQASDDELDA